MSVVRLDNDVGHLCFDLPLSSVNKFNRLTLDELRTAMDLIAGSDLQGLVCSSAKSGFIAGADIGEFAAVFKSSASDLLRWCVQSNAIFTSLEDLPIPTVSIIAGHALGGGLEFCLATDYRIAAPSAVFGFPEVALGICPGFGGTVRAPRVFGVQKAIDWICSGKQYSASQALADGVIDVITERELLLETALEFIQQARQDVLVLNQQRGTKRGSLALSEDAIRQICSATAISLQQDKRNHNPAPMRALETVAQSAVLDRTHALLLEHQTFVALAQSEAAANLIQIFVNEQWLRQRARQLSVHAQPVRRAAVLGAGIMGGGIAYQSALRGIPVLMKDIARQGLDAGMTEASQLLQKQVAKGRLAQDSASQILASITPTLDYAGIESSDLVVEAVVENPRVKKQVLTEVEQHLREDAVLTSNTSTISITTLAQSLKRPENFCGMHFFNPVPLMPLVEVIRGRMSSDQTIATTVAYAQSMGKTPIVVNDCPGFLVNRILFPYFGAFSQLLRDGADYRQVDAAMEAFGWPMGPAWLLDVVGIDTAVHAQAVMAEGFPERMSYGFRTALDLLFDTGHHGQKTGTGFYRYEQQAHGGRPVKTVNAAILEALHGLRGSVREFSAQTIVDRMMLAMCLETVRCLEDGIVSSPIEADMGLVLGLGFPGFRGGALRYIDSMGLAAFCSLADCHAGLGPLYHPTQKMRTMAREKQKFYE